MWYENKKALLEKQEAITDLLESQSYRFRFPSSLEQEYKEYCRHRVRHRIPAVGVSVVAFMLIFVALDFFMLPRFIFQETFLIRVFVIIPLVALVCSWLYLKMPRYYLWPYGLVFLIGSLSVVWIIWRAHSQGVLLPYEGLMITMMYGFVIMGLPLLVSSFLNGLTIFAYGITEPFLYLSFATYINNLLFLGAMYLAGMVSAWILAYSQRSQFLQQELINIREELAVLGLRTKNRYLAVASHDLRQPLQAIQMISEELVKEGKDEKVQQIYSASQSLNSMFNQLLDVSRIQLDTIEIKKIPLSLSEFLRIAVEPYQLTAQKKGIQLHIAKTDVWIKSDFLGLQRIVSNLIQNAMTHSHCQDIWINVFERQGSVIIEVKDNGVGIAVDDQDTVFDEFTRTARSHDVSGLGVGLAIVKQLAEKLGHTLAFHSDQGCSFQLTIDKAEPANNQAQFQSVLIVEDDDMLLHQYVTWFNNWGWKVFASNNCDEGIALLDHQPDVILTDWDVKGRTGEEILNKVGSMEHYFPKCLVVTGNGLQLKTQQEDRDCLVLDKPISASRLRACLQN